LSGRLGPDCPYICQLIRRKEHGPIAGVNYHPKAAPSNRSWGSPADDFMTGAFDIVDVGGGSIVQRKNNRPAVWRHPLRRAAVKCELEGSVRMLDPDKLMRRDGMRYQVSSRHGVNNTVLNQRHMLFVVDT